MMARTRTPESGWLRQPEGCFLQAGYARAMERVPSSLPS